MDLYKFKKGQEIRTKGGQVGYIYYFADHDPKNFIYSVSIIVRHEEERGYRFIERCYSWDGKWHHAYPTDLDVAEVLPYDENSSGLEEALLAKEISQIWG